MFVWSLSCVQVFWDLMDYSLPGFSVHGISQARTLEWVVMPSFRGSSLPKDRTHFSCVYCVAGRFFTAESWGKQGHLPIVCDKHSLNLYPGVSHHFPSLLDFSFPITSAFLFHCKAHSLVASWGWMHGRCVFWYPISTWKDAQYR